MIHVVRTGTPIEPPGDWLMSPVNRRHFLQTAGALTAAGLAANPSAAAKAEDKPVKFRLGLVTYNVAKDWDVPTLVRICKNVGISPVELRTQHKHGVEPTLSKEQRQDVRRRFADGGVEIWGCGTTCEFQSPNASEVRKQIET